MEFKDYRVICVGIGEMGKVGVQTLMDHGVKIVAAVDINDDIVCKDLGEYVGYPAYGVTIEKDLRTAVERTSPNICFCASDPGMDNIKDMMIYLAENKINVATTITDPFYRLGCFGESYDEVDAAFKANGVSLFASGINDVWWSGIGMDMVGTCKRVESVDYVNLLPLEFMGLGVARDFRVNYDPEKYIEEMSQVNLETEESVQGPLQALYVDAEIMGLHITKVDMQANPTICKADRYMPQWDFTIEAGKMTGQSFDIKMDTEEGITLTTSMIVKVLDEDEKPGTTWTVKGEPNLHVELGDICGEITTSATTVNRIPQVVAAKPGIVTLADLTERPVYRHGTWK